MWISLVLNGDPISNGTSRSLERQRLINILLATHPTQNNIFIKFNNAFNHASPRQVAMSEI
jgi:hypothetical protein